MYAITENLFQFSDKDAINSNTNHKFTNLLIIVKAMVDYKNETYSLLVYVPLVVYKVGYTQESVRQLYRHSKSSNRLMCHCDAKTGECAIHLDLFSLRFQSLKQEHSEQETCTPPPQR